MYLATVFAPLAILMAQPAQLEAETVRIEMFGKARKARRMVRPHKPGSHPIATREQVCDPGVDVIPTHLCRSPLFERSLVVRIELTQIVESGRELDVRYEIRWRLGVKADQALGALPRTLSDTLDVSLVKVGLGSRPRCRMRQEIRTLQSHPCP
ncbi:MAG TPA: hypothetical protein VE999_21605 [Gemmataceae bacterium]|nr:hypothetical protein [Gemmataceae bacterium]